MNSSVNLHKAEEKHIPVLAKEQSEDQPLVWRNERLACSPSASAQPECLRGAKLRPHGCHILTPSLCPEFPHPGPSTSLAILLKQCNVLIVPGWDTGYSIAALCFCAALLWALSLLRPEPYSTKTTGLHRTPLKMPHQEAKMAFICNWVNSGQPETRIEKAPYCVLKPQRRLNAEFEFINSLAFWVVISCTNWKPRTKTFRWMWCPPGRLTTSTTDPWSWTQTMDRELWMPLGLTIKRHIWPSHKCGFMSPWQNSCSVSKRNKSEQL